MYIVNLTGNNFVYVATAARCETALVSPDNVTVPTGKPFVFEGPRGNICSAYLLFLILRNNVVMAAYHLNCKLVRLPARG